MASIMKTAAPSQRDAAKRQATAGANLLVRRKSAYGNTPGPTGEYDACTRKRLLRSPAQSGGHDFGKMAVNVQPKPKYEGDHIAQTINSDPIPAISKLERANSSDAGDCDVSSSIVRQSSGRPLDQQTRGRMAPRFGYDFGRVRIHTEAPGNESAHGVNTLAYMAGRDAVSTAGQFAPGTTPLAPTADIQPTPMQAPPAKGPAITVTNGWANPAGKQDRTTVAIGELSSFVVSDVEGGSWKSADGTGTTVNSVSFNWTASTAGTNAITYTAADKTTTSVTMTTVVPSTLSGKKVSDLSYPAGTQGAGMNLTVTMSPTTVSFQALELMEGTCDASAINGYFTSHAPGPHDKAAGAGTWNQVGPANDVPDTAESSGWPSPWSKGSFTWAIPASWRKKGAATSTAFGATNDQVVTITGTDGTTVVTKLGAKTAPRKP